ncbi:MAG: hypothetical protein LBJ67_13190 [Planctomycetaceae bacterium]|jgi:hypothetical protein|nr:hypothetical protein [Planctomycetaceae bacterium]
MNRQTRKSHVKTNFKVREGIKLPHKPDQTIVLESDKCISCGAELDGVADFPANVSAIT